MALPQDAMGLSAVCDCGISRSYSLFLIQQTWDGPVFILRVYMLQLAWLSGPEFKVNYSH